MKNNINKQWLSINNWVYVSIMSDEVLLYNTQNGQFITTINRNHIDFIKQLHERNKLGTILIEDIYLVDSDLRVFIDEAQQKKIFSLFEYNENQPKPIQLMPVLNIQRDVEKLKKETDRSLGEDIIYYLTGLNLFVNNQCALKCNFCEDAVKQFSCCTSQTADISIDISVIQSIATQIKNTSAVNININGGNIFEYPEIQRIQDIFSKKNIYYWFNYSNFQPDIINSKANFEVLIDFPVKMKSLYTCVNGLPKETSRFHFIVSAVEDIENAQTIINELSILNVEYHPFFNGKNRVFFEKNVYLNQEDIFSETISQRKIFCNQALNTNHFGKLYILPNGDVFSNLNAEKVGSIKENSILQLIYNELDINTAWRKTRIDKPCNKCIYQYLCPPPSNYEQVIGKPNLCNLKS